MTGSRTLRRACAAVLAVAALGCTGAATTQVAADSTADTSDETVAVPVQWWSFEGLSATAALTLANSRNARITDLSLDPGDGHTFTGVMVSNTGVYASTWYFYDNVDASFVGYLQSVDEFRIRQLIPYDTTSGRRFTVLLVPNAGAQARTWWWDVDQSPGSIFNDVIARNARVVNFSSYPVGPSTLYSAVMVSNTGSDAKSSWFSTNRTPANIAADLAAENGRLVDLQRQPDGTYNTVTIANTGADSVSWKYLLGLGSLAQVNAAADQYGMRPIRIQRYASPGGIRYDVVMIDNVSAETRRITGLVLPHVVNHAGAPIASAGFYLKQVGGGVIRSLDGDHPFDPATGIGALQNLAIMRQVQQGTIVLASSLNRFGYPHSPSPSWIPVTDRCPVVRDEIAANAVPTSVNALHDAMMTDGDTRALRAITRHFGLPALRQLATTAGLSHTTLGQAFVGCGVQGGRNATTLVDLGHLYEGAITGSLLANTHGARDEFWQPLKGTVVATAIANVVRQEATKLGKSSTIVTGFLSHVAMKSMLGQADVPCNEFSLSCNGVVTKTVFLNYAGRVSLPFKSGGSLAPRTYVFGDYLSNLDLSWSTSDGGPQAFLTSLLAETMRSTVRAALATW